VAGISIFGCRLAIEPEKRFGFSIENRQSQIGNEKGPELDVAPHSAYAASG
jgi:hypothetical protein